jgi:hypothetical protein
LKFVKKKGIYKMENSTSEKLGLTPPKFTAKQRVHWGLVLVDQ